MLRWVLFSLLMFASVGQAATPVGGDKNPSIIALQMTCEGLLNFSDVELHTPYHDVDDMIDALRKIRGTLDKSSANTEALTHQQKNYLITMAFNASFWAKHPVSPEFLLNFLSKSHFASFGSRTNGMTMSAKTRMQLLKVHLEMERPQTTGEIRNTYYDYIDVVRALGSRQGENFEPITAMRLWRGLKLDRDVVLVQGHHPIGGVLLPSAGQTRRLLLYEILARHLGRMPTAIELREAQLQAEQVAVLFKDEKTRWVDSSSRDGDPIPNNETLKSSSYWAYLLSLRFDQTIMTHQEIFSYRLKQKNQINQAYLRVYQTQTPVEIDPVEWDFGLFTHRFN